MQRPRCGAASCCQVGPTSMHDLHACMAGGRVWSRRMGRGPHGGRGAAHAAEAHGGLNGGREGVECMRMGNVARGMTWHTSVVESSAQLMPRPCWLCAHEQSSGFHRPWPGGTALPLILTTLHALGYHLHRRGPAAARGRGG